MLTRNDSLKTTNNCYLNKNKIEYIVVHYTALLTSIINFCLNQKNNNVNGSAHDFVSENEWYQSIDPKHGAYAVGDDNGYGVYPSGITNYNSLNIEMIAEPYKLPPAKTIQNTAEIVAYYMKLYNVPLSKVVRHYDASYKPCPYGMHGNGNVEWNKFKNLVKEYYEGKKEMNYSMYVFSKNWYLKKYNDVAKSAYKDNPYGHYEKYGKREGRKPLPPIPTQYCEGDYLELNKDVAEAVKKGTFTSGMEHYIQYGFNEPRRICKNDNDAAIKKRVEELELKLESIKKIVE